ncbi:hypothetical protein GXW83_19475 [Streptacidiphilus sp. PB12-B1b]|uniref:VWA domain-containing protein n=1 Tax=Streptacidiphilus sp. PB12-B1b TaxID=2705012 RepID=UPI0015FC0132|nr:VWA domain-containing protein [Streptacidiphilus sp. PB12-B1b]QMU77550.1 hypothetical protein GXW83_19475 [Streptacidiphilus sp. PB12-B1b]
MTAMMTKGSNHPVPTAAIHAAVTWRTDAAAPDVDVSALLLDAGGKVRSDADFVFYNQPRHSSGAVRHAGKHAQPGETTDALVVDLAALEPGIDRVVVGASADGGTFGEVPALRLDLRGADGEGLVQFVIDGATTETAFLFGEFYRRGDGWKFRAVGQGYASGLEGLATDFGISVDDDEPQPPAAGAQPAASAQPTAFAQPAAAVQPASAPEPPVGFGPPPVMQPAPAPTPTLVSSSPLPPPAAAPAAAAPGPGLSLKKQKLISLEKQLADRGDHNLLDLTKRAAVSLEKRGLGEHTARVALCLDISGSMGGLYRSGKVQALVERVLALGLRFDDNAEVDVFLFGANAHEAGSVGLDSYRGWTQRMLSQWPLEPGTDYAKAMRLIREEYFGTSERRFGPVFAQQPVYVMFVTDGRTVSEGAAREQVLASSYEPLFWQFMGLGRSSKSVDAPVQEAPQPVKKSRFAKRLQAVAAGWSEGTFRFLEELDQLPGRFADNADFFCVQDPGNITDDQLFELMMAEYPGWLPRARAQGLLPPQ